MSVETERQLIDRAELVKIIEKKHAEIKRLQAELAEWKEEALRLGGLNAANIGESRKTNTALAMRVKKLEDALNSIASWHDGDVVGSHFDEPASAFLARQALSDSDRTADEVISEFLGEPVAYIHQTAGATWLSQHEDDRMPCTALYAPKVKK